jgi:hypothetical protein
MIIAIILICVESFFSTFPASHEMVAIFPFLLKGRHLAAANIFS